MLDNVIRVKIIDIGNHLPLVLIAGPCQIESLDHSYKIADNLTKVCQKLNLPLIFKGSFDKANRTSINTSRGVGIDEGLNILQRVSAEFNCPVLTDVHEPHQCDPVSDVVDIIQIPAYLCRQTNLLIAAGKTGKTINIKKVNSWPHKI